MANSPAPSPAPAPAPAAAVPDVSVIVATSGRVDLLDRCLDALARQLPGGARFEVIVVDDAPHVHTRHLVAVWHSSTGANGPAFHYLPHAGGLGQGAARNRGWQAARAPLLAFLSEDGVASPGWLRHGLAAFGEQVDVLCGRVDVPLFGLPTDDARRQQRRARAEFADGNCFCRKRVLEQLGGFDERFGSSWQAGCDLHFRLLGMGAQLANAPHALVVQPLRPARWGASLARSRSLAFDALLRKKHPQLYRQKIAPVPRYDQWASVTALTLALAGLATGKPALAAPAGVAWALATGQLGLRRLRGSSRSLPQVLEAAVGAALEPPLTLFWRAAGALRFRGQPA